MRTHTLVIGAGSSGCIVAAHLSGLGDRSVLLVDAGPDHRPADLPADLANGHRNAMASHDWGFRHQPSTTPVRMGLPRGRVVGGSSAVNTCIAIRALPRDLEEWRQRGLDAWSWDQCLPAFQAIETDLDLGAARPDIHGSTGPLPLRRHPRHTWTPWQAGFVESAFIAGIPECPDANDPATPEGVGPHAMNQLDGRRISVAEAWLTDEVRQRETLTLWPETTVLELRFAGDRAVGAVVRRGEERIEIEAQQVVLAAGAILTPLLLLRSGIGPSAELDRLGVPLRRPLDGVNHRLLDHPGFAMFLRPRHKSVASPGGPLIQTVLRCSSGEGPWPHDLQLQAGSHVPMGPRDMPFVSLMGMLGKTHGHGTIQWRSLEPGARPLIRSRFHEDPRDRSRAVRAMELARDLAATPPLSELATHLWPSRRRLSTPEGIARWVPWATDSGYHPSGTAPMGTEDDPHAVTDQHGRVHGLQGLHIADASLFPTIPTGNIHLTVLMVAHRIAGWLGASPA
jgi:choline dehydrogenase